WRSATRSRSFFVPTAFFPSYPCAQLPAAAVDILPDGVAQAGDDAALVQGAGDGDGAFPGGAAESGPVDGVVGDEVHDGVLAGEQPRDALHLVVAVVDSFQQRPLILDRIA